MINLKDNGKIVKNQTARQVTDAELSKNGGISALKLL